MKRYRCLSSAYGSGSMVDKIYDADCTWGSRKYTVGDFAREFPKDWELVEDDFVLPKKWCIKHCKEALEWIRVNAEINGYCITQSNYYMYPKDHSKSNFNYVKPKGYTEITFDQFKKYVLKQNVMEKKIIGYKAPSDFGGYKVKGKTFILTTSVVGKWYVYENESSRLTLPSEIVEQWEPIYEEAKKLPKINGYDGNYDVKNNIVKYGCAELNASILQTIYDSRGISKNRYLVGFELDSGVKISTTQIKEILDYIDSQK